MTVPSNLIPTKISELPTLPSPSTSTDTTIFVRSGTTYTGTLAGVLDALYVPNTRTVTAGTNLTGGGALSSNITLTLTTASAASVLFGRGSAGGSGAYQEITLGSGLSMSGTVLSAPEVGTVTSVAATVTGGIVSVAGSPITASGTLAFTVAGTSGGIPYFSAASTWASSAALAANQLVLGGGAGTAPATLGSLGTTTTVYHGNAAGAGTFSAVVLTTDVSGTLPVANGGTGITSFGTGVATFLGTPSSANLLAAVTDETGTGLLVFATNPVLTTPNIGTPSTAVLTNATGTAAGLTAGNVTTNANLTGPITSVGNATAIAAQTGTGTTFVMQASPTLTTPNIGTPSAGVLTNCTGYPGVITWSAITADPGPAVSNTGYLCDTSGAAFTVTLPAAPAVGAVIVLVDSAGTFDTNNLTVGRNALNIMGLGENMTVALEGAWVSLVYQGATNGWRVSA